MPLGHPTKRKQSDTTAYRVSDALPTVMGSTGRGSKARMKLWEKILGRNSNSFALVETADGAGWEPCVTWPVTERSRDGGAWGVAADPARDELVPARYQRRTRDGMAVKRLHLVQRLWHPLHERRQVRVRDRVPVPGDARGG